MALATGVPPHEPFLAPNEQPEGDSRWDLGRIAVRFYYDASRLQSQPFLETGDMMVLSCCFSIPFSMTMIWACGNCNEADVAVEIGRDLDTYIAASMQGHREQASDAKRRITAMGPRAVAPLIDISQSDVPILTRTSALALLSEFGPLNLDQISPLFECARSDPSPEVRLVALRALKELARCELLLPLGITSLKEDDEQIQQEGIRFLAEMRYNDDAVLVRIVDIMLDTRKGINVRTLAAESLGEIDPTNVRAIDALIRALDDDIVRYPAGQSLMNSGARAKAAVPKLIQLMEKEGWGASILGSIGRDAQPAVPVLLKALRNGENVAGQVVAAEALGKIGAKPAEVAPALREVLRSSNPELARTAVEALGKLGRNARQSTPDIVRLLKHNAIDVRLTAITTLGHLDSENRNSLEALQDQLSEPDGRIRARAAVSLLRLGDASAEARQVIHLTLAKDAKDGMARQEILTALATLNPGASEFIPDIIRLLRSGDVYERPRAVNALRSVPDNEAVNAALLGALNDTEPAIRINVVRVFQTRRLRDLAINRELQKLTNDPECDVRRIAREILRSREEQTQMKSVD